MLPFEMQKVKKIIKRHYQLNREITDDETLAEIKSLDGKSWHYIYDDKQRRLAGVLSNLGLVKLTYEL